MAVDDDAPAATDDAPEAPSEEELPEDEWVIAGDYLRGIHKRARTKQFHPEDVELLIPLKYLDVHRITKTDLSDKSEAVIRDHWTNGNKTLSDEWVGHTDFVILRPRPLQACNGFQAV